MGFDILLLLGLGAAIIFTGSDPDTEDADQSLRLQDGDDVQTGSGDDILVNGDPLTTAIEVEAGDGNDLINLVFDLGPEADGVPSIDSGAGDDIVRVTSDLVSIDAGEGNDTVEVQADDSTYGDSTIIGGAGDDNLSSLLDWNEISGGEGNDTIAAPNIEYGTYSGGDGDDTFILDFGYELRFDDDETIQGGAGDDTFLIDATSVQELQGYRYGVAGNEGEDLFEVTHDVAVNTLSDDQEDFELSNSVWIEDFNPDEDRLVLIDDYTGVFSNPPTLSTVNGAQLTNGLFRETVVLSYTRSGVTAESHFLVDSTRPLSADDIELVLNSS